MINQILLYAVNTGAITGCVFVPIRPSLRPLTALTPSMQDGIAALCHPRAYLTPLNRRQEPRNANLEPQFAVKKSSLVFLGLVMIQTKLYANSLLGSLNARAHMRSKGSRGNTYSSASSSGYRVATPRVPVVEVFQQTDILDDRELASQTDLNLENLKGGSLA
ncbi:hypothetical protein TRAPUB_9565 [Trametes pubescens]|uniref:Uncharacterized protein n=1 Tax=Trametes pubescens TaxID=154538 RepID=A0A1M2W263_TRAPU|nr:hypothetical protein TRAPUB_9565 [Trametes pubescens]